MDKYALDLVTSGSVVMAFGIPLRNTNGHLKEPDMATYTGGKDRDESADRLRESMDLSRSLVKGYIPADEVAGLLGSAGIKAVLIGGPVIGCYTGTARSSKDADFIVSSDSFRAACSTIKSNYKELKEFKGQGFSRFMEASETDPVERIDILRADSPMMEKTLEHAVKLKIGTTDVFIPDVDHLVALKFAALTSDSRAKEKQSYDLGDIQSLVKSCALNDDYIASLCDEMQSGYGGLYLNMVEKIRG